MNAKRHFEEQLAALERLRHEPPAATVKPLRKALSHRSNYIVAKAADLVRELHLGELVPDLLAAFDRYFVEPVKTDPQCWAKNALSRALAALEFDDAGVYLRGMRHLQFEPVWGGPSDTAGPLRATCARALTACRRLPEAELLSYLIELFADKDKSVRVEAARAVEQAGSRSAALLLRLRATLGGDEPEVLGACYSGVLSIEGAAALPWIGRFLAGADDAAAEAALAIAADRTEQAFSILHERFLHERDPWFQGVLVSAMALTRQPAGLEFLLRLIQTNSPQAEAAIEALLRSIPSPEVLQQIESMVAGKPRLARALAGHRPASR